MSCIIAGTKSPQNNTVDPKGISQNQDSGMEIYNCRQIPYISITEMITMEHVDMCWSNHVTMTATSGIINHIEITGITDFKKSRL